MQKVQSGETPLLFTLMIAAKLTFCRVQSFRPTARPNHVRGTSFALHCSLAHAGQRTPDETIVQLIWWVVLKAIAKHSRQGPASLRSSRLSRLLSRLLH